MQKDKCELCFLLITIWFPRGNKICPSTPTPTPAVCRPLCAGCHFILKLYTFLFFYQVFQPNLKKTKFSPSCCESAKWHAVDDRMPELWHVNFTANAGKLLILCLPDFVKFLSKPKSWWKWSKKNIGFGKRYFWNSFKLEVLEFSWWGFRSFYNFMLKLLIFFIYFFDTGVFQIHIRMQPLAHSGLPFI